MCFEALLLGGPCGVRGDQRLVEGAARSGRDAPFLRPTPQAVGRASPKPQGPVSRCFPLQLPPRKSSTVSGGRQQQVSKTPARTPCPDVPPSPTWPSCPHVPLSIFNLNFLLKQWELLVILYTADGEMKINQANQLTYH